MKLTALLTAALPLLAVAAPPSNFVGDSQQGDSGLKDSAHASEGDWVTIPKKDGGQQMDRPDAKFNQAAGWGEDHEVNDKKHGNMHQRDLNTRDSLDHYMQECKQEWTDKTGCVTNLIVPKGSKKGPCVARIQKTSDGGRLHILDRNVMCRYYEKNGCAGAATGPYSNAEMDYTMNGWLNKQISYNPQSYQCQTIGFQAPDVPIKVPGEKNDHTMLHTGSDGTDRDNGIVYAEDSS